MAAVTHVLTLDYVASILDEDVELLKAIVSALLQKSPGCRSGGVW